MLVAAGTSLQPAAVALVFPWFRVGFSLAETSIVNVLPISTLSMRKYHQQIQPCAESPPGEI